MPTTFNDPQDEFDEIIAGLTISNPYAALDQERLSSLKSEGEGNGFGKINRKEFPPTEWPYSK